MCAGPTQCKQTSLRQFQRSLCHWSSSSTHCCSMPEKHPVPWQPPPSLHTHTHPTSPVTVWTLQQHQSGPACSLSVSRTPHRCPGTRAEEKISVLNRRHSALAICSRRGHRSQVVRDKDRRRRRPTVERGAGEP